MGMKKCPNGQEVSQSLLVDIPAVTENHRDWDVGKSLKCSLKNSKSSKNYAVYYRKIHCLTSEFHVKFHAKTDIARIANCITKAT